MSLEEMIAQLCEDVNNKNVGMEKSLDQTNWCQIDTDTQPIKKETHRNLANQENAVINKVFNKLKERDELNNLTDSFRSVAHQETRSKTERSLASVVASFSRYNTLVQAAC